MNKRIFILTYCYAPMVNPRSLRWTSLAEDWAHRGYEVHVLTSRQPGEADQSQLHGVNIYRSGSKIGAKARKAQEALNQNIGFSFKTWVLRILRWIYRNTIKQLQWPDYSASWWKQACKIAPELFEKISPDYLVSVSSPFSGHLLGLQLKKANPQVKWLADSGDPFALLAKSDNIKVNNQFLFAKKNNAVEKEILELADQLSVPTLGMRELYLQWLPKLAPKFKHIPPLINTRGDSEAPDIHGAHGYRMAFFGTLYPGIRNPKAPLRFLLWLRAQQPDKPWEMHFYGDSRECVDQFKDLPPEIADAVHIHGLIPPDAARTEMFKSDFLVNIANRTAYGFPSKVVEYASTSKPILNFTVSENDGSTLGLKAYPRALHLLEKDWTGPDVSAEQKNKILGFLNSPPKLDPEFLNQWISQFKIDSISSEYLSAMGENP